MSFVTYATPAVLIAVFAYATRYFGKIIADQKPFVDDRSWDIELSGIYFVLNLAVSAAFGVSAAVYGSHYTSSWVNIFVFLGISLIGGSIFSQNLVLGEKVYKIKTPLLSGGPEQIGHIIKETARVSAYVPRPIFEFFLFYLVTLGFLAGNFIWFGIMLSQGFFILTIFALNSSLKRIGELPKAEIYLIGVADPIKNLTLLKVNNDNIRVRSGKKIILFNKNQVLKLEMKIPAKATK